MMLATYGGRGRLIKPAGAATVAQLERALDALEDTRDRLYAEWAVLEVAAQGMCATETWSRALTAVLPAVRAASAVLCRLNIGELQTRADAAAALILAVDDLAARADDAADSGERLAEWLQAVERATGTVVTYSPVRDLGVDARELARGIGNDLQTAASLGVVALVAAAVVAVAVTIGART